MRRRDAARGARLAPAEVVGHDPQDVGLRGGGRAASRTRRARSRQPELPPAWRTVTVGVRILDSSLPTTMRLCADLHFAPALARRSPRANPPHGLRVTLAAHTSIYPIFTINDMEKAAALKGWSRRRRPRRDACTTAGRSAATSCTAARLTSTARPRASSAPRAARRRDARGGAASLDEIGVMGSAADLAAAKERRRPRLRVLGGVGRFLELQEGAGEVAATAELLHDPADVHARRPGEGGAVHAAVRRRDPGREGLRLLRLDDQRRQALLPRGRTSTGAAVDATSRMPCPSSGDADSGAASLDKIEVHGPKAELEKCKARATRSAPSTWTYATGRVRGRGGRI